MKIFFDTEFLEDGQTIDLISIGMIRDDGKTLYRISSDFNDVRARSDKWIRENVLAHLGGLQTYCRSQIALDVLEFVSDIEKPEFWAYYADYDWVALCQLYGRMIDLPKGWPMYCRDLKQVIDQTGIKPPKQNSIEHHALSDAMWVRDAFHWVRHTYVTNPNPETHNFVL